MYNISFETKCGSEKSRLLNVSSSVYSARHRETPNLIMIFSLTIHTNSPVHCKNELHLMHFCNGTYLSQNHEHLRHIKHIRYKITVTCSTSAMPQAHGALYITSAKIGWGAWSASCMGISRYLLSLTRMEWNWAPPQAHGSCTMRLNILHPCAWCEHRFYSAVPVGFVYMDG